MTVNTQKRVRVIAGPTGPTGTFQGVHILAAFTGPTGTYPQWAQQGPTGQGIFETVYVVGATGATGRHKTVIITGYTGPA